MKISAMVMAAAALSATAFGGTEAIENMQTPEQGVKAQFSFGGEANGQFMLNGKPFQIRSGEMHPQRIPRSHWQQRIRAAKAMGLNTIAFYTFWNALEKKDGNWDFSGINDIAAFIDLCREEGMWVLFRPGPYTCGEWDLGGLPIYLIKDLPVNLRTTKNAAYMKAAERYFDQMAKIAIPRLCKNGGPILMIQLENEYGSYRSEHDEMAYIEWIRDYWTKKGAGPFYVSEGSSANHLRFVPEGVAVGLDPAEKEGDLVNARKVAKNAPIFSSETYPGWLRHWGEGNWEPTRNTLNSVRWYMQTGFSFNIFVEHGGTSFGLTAGANSNPDGSKFQADMTSYDYGAPIGENGNLTREYFEYRDIIQAALPPGTKLPEPPQPDEAQNITSFTPEFVCTFSALATKQTQGKSFAPPTLEAEGQNQGIGIYRAVVPAGAATTLKAPVHDYAQVYIDDKYIGTIDRTKGQLELQLPERKKPAKLRIVLDTFGHVNFSSYLEKDYKGLGAVTLGNGEQIKDWSLTLLPLDGKLPHPRAKARTDKKDGEGALFRAEVKLHRAADTFLDMSKWSKGYVWVNGHLLGRYWNRGPQERLYCPADFLKEGDNTVIVLDIEQNTAAPIRGCTERNTEVTKHTESLNNAW